VFNGVAILGTHRHHQHHESTAIGIRNFEPADWQGSSASRVVGSGRGSEGRLQACQHGLRPRLPSRVDVGVKAVPGKHGPLGGRSGWQKCSALHDGAIVKAAFDGL